ncbi:MAG TPA: hypothetical protein VGK77_09420 [Candidatus Binatia bacterium]
MAGSDYLFYAPPWQECFLSGAHVSSDGKGIYFPFSQATLWQQNAWWTSALGWWWSKHQVKQTGIALFDLETKKVAVIYRRKSGSKGIGHRSSDEYGIVTLCWDKAIVNFTVKPNPDDPKSYETAHSLLDLKSGHMTALPLRQELAKLGRRGPEWPHLVDRNGTIILTARQSDLKSEGPPADETWIRYPTGQYFYLAVGGSVEALGNGQLLFRGNYATNFLYDVEKGSHKAISAQESINIKQSNPWRHFNDRGASWCSGASPKIIRLEIIPETFPGRGFRGKFATFRILRRTAKSSEEIKASVDLEELEKQLK